MDSLGQDAGTPAVVREAVPEAFLLQLGALLREEPCTQVLCACAALIPLLSPVWYATNALSLCAGLCKETAAVPTMAASM